MIWHGIWITVAQNVANSIRNNDLFSASCLAVCRGVTGTSKALQAFRLQAREAMTIYAQLLTRLSTGVVKALTPLLSWATRFSWSQRSLALNTIWSAGVVRSLVI